jgi:Zn-dependent peptidase ImmA (M78 family)
MNSINIFGLRVKIKTVDLSQCDYDGLYNGNDKTIYIDRKLKGQHRKQVLMHEIIHALFDRIGAHQLAISQDAEEIIAEQLSVFLVETLKIKV